MDEIKLMLMDKKNNFYEKQKDRLFLLDRKKENIVETNPRKKTAL